MNPGYTRYHPRWYRRRMPIFWWLRKTAYVGFIVRELTSLPVAYAGALLLVQVWMAARGEAAYAAFRQFLELPAVAVFHALVLVGLVVHAITWLNLAPKAMVVRIGGRRVPGGAVLAAHYAAWLAVSAAVIWLLLGRT